ncbi:tail fiber assembly protein [Pseudomonas mosselii]|uniref:tail fiber assembly protein n=1 Tax=Pseudomonas mosselii TaxID=78327 RepID=UPI0016487DB0|nr:tail fiber assembly protein [Pseudomonas mosselii]MBC3456369.1 tail fiber assembly protein [Pseudomonas mosselii]
MKYYLETVKEQVFGFEEDGSQDFLLTPTMRPLTDDELQLLLNPPSDPLEFAQLEAGRLRKVADDAIAPLQDAVDLDEATEAEALRLKEWKRYRVALNRLPEQPDYPAVIDWPAPPA